MRRSGRGSWSMPRVVAAIVVANLRRLSRDRTGLVFIVAVPFLLILLIGVASPTGDADGSVSYPVGLVAPEGDDGSAARLVEALAAEPTLRIVRFDDVDAMTSAVRRRVQAAGIEIPDDLDERLAAGLEADVRFHADPSGMPPLQVRTAVAQAVSQTGAGIRGARVVSERRGIPIEAVVRAADDVPAFGGTDVVEETVGSRPNRLPSGFTYAAPAYLVLFVFINTVVAAWGMPADRTRGIVRRTFAAPTSASAVLIGEALYRFLVAVLQASLILVIGALIFGVAWGDPFALAAIVVLFSLASTGASVLVGSIATTPQQVTGLGPPLGIGLGMLGGCMWPLEIVGPVMQTIGHATPHAWAVDAFLEVVGSGGGIADVATELAALAAFAAGFLVVALIVFGRVLGSARG